MSTKEKFKNVNMCLFVCFFVCVCACLFVCVFFLLVNFVKLVHVLKEIKTLYRVFGPRALYLACRALASSGTLLDTKPSVQKHDKESLFP